MIDLPSDSLGYTSVTTYEPQDMAKFIISLVDKDKTIIRLPDRIYICFLYLNIVEKVNEHKSVIWKEDNTLRNDTNIDIMMIGDTEIRMPYL